MQILTLAFLLLVSSGDGESVYKALDQNDSTALERYDTKKIMKAIREGRPAPPPGADRKTKSAARRNQ